jgi:molybdate transport system substrate-binding protein
MRIFLAWLSCLMSLASPAQADTTLIAVATNFAAVADELVAEYQAQSGDKITLTSGATGKLFAQIRAGAPSDAFLSADSATVSKLIDTGGALDKTRFTYAVGRLVLWSADPKLDLSDPALAMAAAHHVAIANPDLAPYGMAAREAIKNLGFSDALKGKIVMGENIGQTLSMVASGAAELGFVAASSLVGPNAPKGTAWPLPPNSHSSIRQDAVLLTHGAENRAARGFLSFLASDAGRKIVRNSGYGLAP